MSITDELRKWAEDSTLSSWTAEHLTAIADRIDAEHESACAEAYGNGVMSVPIALDESAWVELPKDADGEYIHIGDVMEGEKIGGGYGEPFEVVGYVMSNGELEPMDEHRNPRKRKYSRHHHPDSWERIIEDARTCTGSMGSYTSVPTMRWTNEMDALVARCKALAGDAE